MGPSARYLLQNGRMAEITEVVEYVKASNESDSEAYDWDKDEIVQSIPLTKWLDIPGIVDDEDGVISYFTATTKDMGTEGGSVALLVSTEIATSL